MERLLRKVTSQRGKEAVVDSNNFQYINNGRTGATARRRCSRRSCPATIITRNSTGDLASGSLPDHNQSNKPLKLVVKNTEATLINHFATLPDTERSLDGRTRIKFLLGGYDMMSKKDLILMLAHDMRVVLPRRV